MHPGALPYLDVLPCKLQQGVHPAPLPGPGAWDLPAPTIVGPLATMGGWTGRLLVLHTLCSAALWRSSCVTHEGPSAL